MAEREKVMREVFELDRDAMYPGHRQLFLNDPLMVGAYPDPGIREQMLLGSWRRSTESHYQGYRDAMAKMSEDDLLELQSMLKRMIAAERLQEILGTPSGDNGQKQEQSKSRDGSRGI